MSALRTLCVYCGSSQGVNPLHVACAKELGQALAQAGIRLVYGGGAGGLMGTLARAVLEKGGYVIGIVPDFLQHIEPTIQGSQELILVPDMHTRKRMMFERADAFVALPGGIGTLEELVEQLAWLQLHQHRKPVLLANLGGFWHPLLSLFAHMRQEGFIRPDLEVNYLVAERVNEIIPILLKALKRQR